MITDSEVKNAIEAMFRAFTGKGPEPVTAMVYLDAFARERMSNADIVVSCEYAIDHHSEFVPSPALVIEYHYLTMGYSEDSIIGSAFELLLDTVREVGSYRLPEFEDGALQWTIHEMGGWEGVCGSNSEWLRGAGRKRFADLYRRFWKQGREPPGLRCISNGHEPDPVVPVACAYLPPNRKRDTAAFPATRQLLAGDSRRRIDRGPSAFGEIVKGGA